MDQTQGHQPNGTQSRDYGVQPHDHDSVTTAGHADNDESYSHDVEAGPPTNRVNTLGAKEETSHPSLAQRSLRVTWAWFPCTMSTGSLASLLANQPYTFAGLLTIGKIFYILNLVLFSFIFVLIVARFARKPRAISTSLHHPSESFFFGAFWVSIALILLGMQTYGVPSSGVWLVKAMRVLFWIYYACALLVAIFQYHVIFHAEKLTVSDAMPAWILPAYPFLVVGILSSSIAKTQPPESGLQIHIAGICGQGLGWIVAFFIYTVYLTRLMNSRMPSPSVRPGMYVSVGPAAYTCAGILKLGKQAKTIVPEGFLGITSFPVGDLWLAFSVPVALFLWLIAVWFSALSSLSVARGARKMTFSLQWWAFVFPNAGLALATIAIGEALDSRGIKITGSVITVILIPFWLLCAVAHIRAVWRHEILYPGKDLGVDDVNWAHDAKKEKSRQRKEQRRGNRNWTQKMLQEKRTKDRDA